jgi:hypothetical protein
MDSHDGRQVRHPVSYDEAATSKYLAAGDFADGPRTFRVLDIEIVPIEDDSGATNDKFIYHLEGAAKPWLSNRTNGYLLEGIFGPDPMAVKGQYVTLHAETVQTSEGRKPAVRVYGSPCLKADKAVTYKLKRKKPVTKTLRATQGPGGQRPTAPAQRPPREPGDDQPPPPTDDDFRLGGGRR